MRVEKLILRNFRNIEECVYTPDPKLNFLVGPNGQGKTSFLEALSFLATLRSFRGAKLPEVVRWGQDASEVNCTLTFDDENPTDWRTDLKLGFVITDPERRKATKVAFINGKAYKSSTAYLSQRFGSFELGFHTVIFNPSDHDLVRGEPALRRSYLDRVVAAEDVDYLKALQKYQRVLEQRNSVLRDSETPNRDLLFGFSEPLAKYGAFLTHKRLKWLERLTTRLNDLVHYITGPGPELRLVYLSNWVSEIDGLCIPNNNLGSRHFAGHQPVPSLELLEQSFWKRLSDLESVEWRSRHSLVGPHRDDWAFFLGGQALKGHGSQGEVRSALLALKLAEVELFRNETGHRPLFLLDDFSSELDRARRAFLLKFLSETDLQVFVTTTEDSVFAGKRYQVLNGSLKEAAHDHSRHQPEPECS